MKIEEIIRLRELEKDSAIPQTPKRKLKTDKQAYIDECILNVMAHTVSDEKDSQRYVNANFFEKLILRNCGIKQLKKSGEGYRIKTIYGDSVFFNSQKVFVGGETPETIEKGMCFKNCINYALSAQKDCDVVCGLINVENTSITHAVIDAGCYIIDFNFDMVMSADLYYELMDFEELNRVSAERLSRDHALLLEYSRRQEYPLNMGWAVLFAYDEYIKMVNGEKKLV